MADGADARARGRGAMAVGTQVAEGYLPVVAGISRHLVFGPIDVFIVKVGHACLADRKEPAEDGHCYETTDGAYRLLMVGAIRKSWSWSWSW